MSDDWQPSCSLKLIRLRAELLCSIRSFFSERSVLEVETPLLGNAVGTDPNLAFFTSEYDLPPRRRTLFLQTSPEFAMKRLLAAGSGSIFQVCKAFRNGESGRFHNPEFTLLEWYRVGFNLADLMDECDQLITRLFLDYRPLKQTQRVSYHDIFKRHTGLNPLIFPYRDYCAYAEDHELSEALDICGDDHSTWLDFLFSHKVQPHLGENALCMVYGYPACQSSLARLSRENPLVTDRVELFIDGIELANGFYELTEAVEQNSRFDHELALRKETKLPTAKKDERLIAAIESGLPESSGMAMGLDRVLMVRHRLPSINDVLCFPIDKA
ncbi:MAG: EF-P lysine aminoacylase EpmA [Gammaproteobacteria bacterium]